MKITKKNDFNGDNIWIAKYYNGEMFHWKFEDMSLDKLDKYLLESLVIPFGVTEIRINEFEYCDFTKVVIPNSVTKIGDWVLEICKSLKSITLSDNCQYTFDSFNKNTKVIGGFLKN